MIAMTSVAVAIWWYCGRMNPKLYAGMIPPLARCSKWIRITPKQPIDGLYSNKSTKTADYKTITTAMLRAIGPGVPVVSVLEGGYAEAAITDGLKGHLEGLKSA